MRRGLLRLSSVAAAAESSRCLEAERPSPSPVAPARSVALLPWSFLSEWLFRDFHVLTWLKANPSARIKRTRSGLSRIDQPLLPVASRSRYGGNAKRELLANFVRVFRDVGADIEAQAVELLTAGVSTSDIGLENDEVDVHFACLYLNGCALFRVSPQRPILKFIEQHVLDCVDESEVWIVLLCAASHLLGMDGAPGPGAGPGTSQELRECLRGILSLARRFPPEQLSMAECTLVLDAYRALEEQPSSATWSARQGYLQSLLTQAGSPRTDRRMMDDYFPNALAVAASTILHAWPTAVAERDAVEEASIRTAFCTHAHTHLKRMLGSPHHAALAFRAASYMFAQRHPADVAEGECQAEAWDALDPFAAHLHNSVLSLSPFDTQLVMGAIAENPVAVARYRKLPCAIISLICAHLGSKLRPCGCGTRHPAPVEDALPPHRVGAFPWEATRGPAASEEIAAWKRALLAHITHWSTANPDAACDEVRAVSRALAE